MSLIFSRPLFLVGFTAAAAFTLAPSALAVPAPTYEALLEKLDQNPLSIESMAAHEAAEGRALQAHARPNPTISLEAENAYGSGPFNGYDAADTTFSISQPLELWGQRGARIDAAQAQVEVTGIRRDQMRWVLSANLAQAYAEAEAASLRYDLAAQALSLTQADAEAVLALIDKGREAALRGVQAESEVEAARANVDVARANREAAFGRLSALSMLAEPITSIGDDLLNRVPQSITSEPRELPAVKVAKAELDAAERQVNVERLRARPDVTAAFGVRRFEEYRAEALAFGVSVTLPLFDRNTGAISAARAEQRAAEARLTSQEWAAQAERRAAQSSLDASISRTAAADAGEVAAEEAYRLARIGFDAGRISQLELRSSRAALIAAGNNAVDARLARALAEIALARLVGRAPFVETF